MIDWSEWKGADMRLIDTDALIEAINKSTCNWAEYMWKKVVYDVISNQPTAYDVEKVVAELENEDNHLTYGGIPFKEPPIKVSDAIDIVKRGGVE